MTPAKDLLLKQGEFPAGYQVEPLNADDIDAVFDGVGVLSNARITPAQCKPAFGRGTIDQAKNTAVVAAVNQFRRSVLSEALSTDPADGTATTPGCEKVRFQVDRVPGTGETLDFTVSVTPIALPGTPPGSKAAVTRTVGRVTTDGETVNIDQEQVLASALVRGYTVVVAGQTIEPVARLDRGDVAATLTRAVDKVRAAR